MVSLAPALIDASSLACMHGPFSRLNWTYLASARRVAYIIVLLKPIRLVLMIVAERPA